MEAEGGSLTSEAVVVSRWVSNTESEGPGNRFAVWVQGCSIRCPGCFNPHLWTTRGGARYTPAELNGLVGDDVEGITLLGGEPFDQAASLAQFATLVRSRGLSVMTFTGFVLEDLRRSGDRSVSALLDQTDLLVDGRFEIDQLDLLRPWVGSRNQRFHALTARYEFVVDDLEEGLLSDQLEVRVSSDGTVRVNGWATDQSLETLLHGLGTRPALRL